MILVLVSIQQEPEGLRENEQGNMLKARIDPIYRGSENQQIY